MKTLFLIRHAKSSWEDASLADHDRPLNPRGLRDAPFMAKMLRAREGQVDHIISSPANRAYTTASYFAEAMEIDLDKIDIQKRIYEAFESDVLSIIRATNDQFQRILVFGHNPTFTGLANQFSTQYIPNVPTCGIVKIEAEIAHWKDFSPQTGKQTAFYFPKQYF